MARKPKRKPVLKTRMGKGSAVAAIVIASVTASEGVRLVAYKDHIGTGQPWTVCAGETRGVNKGDVYTLAQCQAMLGNRLVEFEGRMIRCMTKPESVPDGVWIASISLAYNIGSAAYCRSSVNRYTNAGQYRKACDAILLWNRAGGKVVRGLQNRRRHERKICLNGLTKISAPVKLDPITESKPKPTPPITSAPVITPKKRPWWKRMFSWS